MSTFHHNFSPRPDRNVAPPLFKGIGPRYAYGVSEISIVLNGEPRQVPERCTVSALLELLELDPTQVAVERNLDVVPRARYAEARLSAGDSIEVVTFVGGGA